MRDTKRVTRAARAAALIGSTLLALALPASPGYAGPDHADQGRHQPHSLAGQDNGAGQPRVLRGLFAHRNHGQAPQTQSTSSDDLECTTTVTGGNFDSVTVPEGETCILANSTVDGNVTVEEDAQLAAVNNMIGGNLAGDGYDTVQARDNRIRGNVRLQNGGPSADAFFEHLLCGNLVGGNVSLQRSTGFVAVGGPECTDLGGGNIVGGNLSVTDSRTNAPDEFHVDDNLVGGNTDINNNRGNGTKTVQNNLINQTLSCNGNQNPFTGTPNNADRARGQCAP